MINREDLITLTTCEEERAKEIHDKAIVIDAHSDIGSDIIWRRAIFEKEPLKRIHMRAGGLNNSMSVA